MYKQFQNITPKTLFKFVFVTYMLVGMHISIDHMGGYGLYLPFNTIGWMFFSLMIGLGFWQIGKTGKIEYSRFQLLCWTGFGLLCLPYLYPNNVNAGLSFQRILGLGGGLSLFFALGQFRFHKEDRYHLLYIILGGILIQTFYGLAQHFLPVEELIGKTPERPFGVLMQKNVMATFLVTGAAVSLFLLFKDKVINNSQIKTGLIYAVPFLTSILYLPLQSRTGYLAFPIAIGMISLIGMKKKKQLVFWLGLALIGFIIGAQTPFKSRTDQNLQSSSNFRKVVYELTFEMWKNQPFIGVGYGNYFSSFRKFYAERKSKDPSLKASAGNMDHPHNETLLWLAEGGIAPFFGLLIIAGGFLVMLWRTNRKEAIGMAGLIMPILIHTQLELPFYLSVVHWFLFIFILSCIDEEFGQWKTKTISLSISPKIIAVLVPVIVIPTMVTILQTGFVITKYERTGFNNPDLLLSAWNPSALKKKYEVHAMTLHLQIAKKTNDRARFQDYIRWAETFVQHSPFPFIYYDLSKAYEAIGQPEKGWEVYNKARYLFPDTKWQDVDKN
tara:strand:- start:3335 stop:4999 length:1665 start_codon:yes stop_codon:yes gene_type:complete